jgi:hypothetical protein
MYEIAEKTNSTTPLLLPTCENVQMQSLKVVLLLWQHNFIPERTEYLKIDHNVRVLL